MQINSDFFKKLFTQGFVSEYNHSNYIDKLDNKPYFHMDCSGFIYWCLAQMGYKRALVELRSFLKQKDFLKINRFFCRDFASIYAHKKEFKYWNFIDKPIPDCVLIVVFPDGNGHCMFVDKIIKTSKTNTCLRVIDLTRYPHKKDTRTSAGIGVGEIEIIYENNNWLYNSNNKCLPIRKSDVYFVVPIKKEIW